MSSWKEYLFSCKSWGVCIREGASIRINTVSAFHKSTYPLFPLQITQEKTCFTFRAERWYPVANLSIQHMINVYEYAETGKRHLRQKPNPLKHRPYHSWQLLVFHCGFHVLLFLVLSQIGLAVSLVEIGKVCAHW